MPPRGLHSCPAQALGASQQHLSSARLLTWRRLRAARLGGGTPDPASAAEQLNNLNTLCFPAFTSDKEIGSEKRCLCADLFLLCLQARNKAVAGALRNFWAIQSAATESLLGKSGTWCGVWGPFVGVTALGHSARSEDHTGTAAAPAQHHAGVPRCCLKQPAQSTWWYSAPACCSRTSWPTQIKPCGE